MLSNKGQNDSLEGVLTTDYMEIDSNNIEVPISFYRLRDVRLALGLYILPEEFEVMRKKAAAICFP